MTFGQTSGKTFNANDDVLTGNTLMHGYSFGLKATHFAASGIYVDAGLNVKTGKNSQIYLNIGYDTLLSNRYQGVYGRAGMQFAF